MKLYVHECGFSSGLPSGSGHIVQGHDVQEMSSMGRESQKKHTGTVQTGTLRPSTEQYVTICIYRTRTYNRVATPGPFCFSFILRKG
jgi:hypothetical protein